MNAPPIRFTWDGESLTPASPHWARMADKAFVIGEAYPMVEYEDRSAASHNHQFAWLNDRWMSLSEKYKDTYPTPDHLRKRALIQAGFFHEEMIDVGSKAGALRVAAYARSRDEFAHVVVRGAYIVIRTAKSQSRRAMDKAEFQASKQAVLEIVDELLGITAGPATPATANERKAA